MDRAVISPKRQETLGRDWTKGGIFTNLLSLAWPIQVKSIFDGIRLTIDLIWVGKLGVAPLAGVGVAAILVMFLDNLKMGLDQGSRAMVARLFGAKDYPGANHVAEQAYVVTIGFAAIIASLGFILADPILRVMGLTPEVVAQGTPYLRIQFIGIITMGLVRQNEGIMQSSGDTVNPMKITLFYILVHATLCPFLVLGWWIFPRLETSGAAYSMLISAFLGAIIGLWLIVSGRTRIKLSFRNFHPDVNIIWRIVKIGVPASVTGIERNLGYLLLTRFVATFGEVAVAAYSLMNRIDTFIHVPGSGLGQAAGVLAAQNLGARQPERAEKSGWLAVGLYTILMVVASFVVWFWGKSIIGIFNTEPELLELTHTFLKITIVAFMVFGLALSLQQCLTGIGDTVPTMLIVLLSMGMVQTPAAFFLSRFTSLGAYGIPWGFAMGTLVSAVSYATYFRLGRWKRKKV